MWTRIIKSKKKKRHMKENEGVSSWRSVGGRTERREGGAGLVPSGLVSGG